MSRRPLLSVVIIARNEGEELRRTVENLGPRLPERSEVIVFDDGSTDGSAGSFGVSFSSRGGSTPPQLPSTLKFVRQADPLGVAAARNRGALLTSGEILLFADAHIRVPDGFFPHLARALDRPGVGAVAPAIRNLRGPTRPSGYGLTFTGPALDVKWLSKQTHRPFDVPILPGCCVAMTRDTFQAAGGWDESLLHRGGVDNEFSLRHWLLGYRLQVIPDVEVGHLFRKRSPFPVGWPQYLHNRLRCAVAHFSPTRLSKVIAALSHHEELNAALHLAAENGAWRRRRELFLRRTRNDDWYFRKFGLEW